METNLDRALKQRLLGAVILAALLVIIVPEWLDGAGHRSRYSQNIEMRDKPVFQSMQEIMPEASKEVIKSNSKTSTRKRSSIRAWALQVGSFEDKANANMLRDKLMAKKFPAYVDPLKTPEKTVYRVRIGPELDRLRLAKLKQEVFKSEKLKGMVVNHP